MKFSKIVEQNRATSGLRFANYIVDLIVFYLLLFLFAFSYGIITRDVGFFDRLENMNPILDRILTMIFYALYLFTIETILKGRSIGKYITGTKVIMVDGTQPQLTDYFIRNISRAVPFDQLSFLGNNGWHDKWSNTRVVKISDYGHTVKMHNDINTIGAKENS